MKNKLNMISGVLVTVFSLGLIVFGVLAVFNPGKIEDLASFLSEKTGLFAVEETGIRGQLEYAEGQVEKRSSEEDGWHDVERNEVVKSGMEIRTIGNSRAVITFEDGSVVRLGKESSMKFLSEDALILVQFRKGEIYNRVATDMSREFALEVDNFRVVALGTAFDVKKEANEDAEVLVVESKVEVKGDGDVALGTISEGNKSKLGSSNVKEEKITQEDFKDEFLSWNIENDEKHFEKISSLKEIKKEESKEAAKKEIAPKKVVTPKVEPKKEVSKQEEKKEDNDGYATAVGLSGKDDGTRAKLNWTISGGKAPEGFKVVKSKQPNPVYPGDDYLYIKDPNDRSCVWKGFYKDKTYHFRVCVYKKGKCVTYSNDIEIEFEGK